MLLRSPDQIVRRLLPAWELANIDEQEEEGGKSLFWKKDIRFDASNIEIKGGFEGKKGTKALWFMLSHGFTCYAVKAN